MGVATDLEERLVVIVAPGKNQMAVKDISGRKFSLVRDEHSAQLAPILTSLEPRLLVASHSDAIFVDSARAGELLRAVGAPILLVNS
jgi:hypothetical protein